MYYIYMLNCTDNTIYTGITTNIERRLQEHTKRGKKCAKYTYVHKVDTLLALWSTTTRKQASTLEYHLKHIKKFQKLNIIKNNDELNKILSHKIDISQYQRLDISHQKKC